MAIPDSLPTFVQDRPLADQLTARNMNQIVAYLRSITVQPGVGVFIRRTVGGTTVDARPGKGGGGADPNWLAVNQYWTSLDDLNALKDSLATPDDPDPDVRQVQPVFTTITFDLSNPDA